jgi:uncharacterized surface anchored protein
VSLYYAEQERRTVKVSADGTFRLADLVPERYRVMAYLKPFGYLKSVRSGGRELEGQTVNIDGSAELEVVVSAKVASVTGQVHLDGGDRPAAGVSVVLIPQEKDRSGIRDAYEVATTDESGRFSIRGIVPGDYRAYAWESLGARGSEYMDPEFIRPLESKGVAVTLSEGGSANLDLIAIPAGK